MNNDRFSMDSTLGELLEQSAALDFFNIIAPGMIDSPAIGFMRGASLKQLVESSPENKQKAFTALLDAANGREVNFTLADPKTELPQVDARGSETYDMDDIDGKWYMLEHGFSGCLVARFTKTMDETVYGRITCNGRELPKGIIKSIEVAGGIQMLGIPVREVFTEYDTEYILHVEGFKDTDGNVMKPQSVTARTLPKPMPDPIYAEHDEVALQAAREGMVLLKNEGNILPLAPDSKLYIEGASKFRIGAVGAGRINPRYSIGLSRAVDEFSNFKFNENAETGIFVVSRASGENFDNNAIKGEFYLSEEEEEQISRMANRYKNTVAIISSGYPMDLRWVEKYKIDAVIWCGFSGMLGGKALVEILDGRVNPSGKLPDTWSNDYFDIPASANFYRAKDADSALSADFPYFIDTCYEEDIYVGYRYFETFDKPVAYPFGFGLSYTKFDINTSLKDMNIFATVKNIGNTEGKEVVQVYVKIPEGKLEQPAKRLVGFAKTCLLVPGETQELDMEIAKNSLASFHSETSCWIMEKGKYEFYAGSSIKNLSKCGELVLEEDEIIKKVENLMAPPIKLNTLSKKNPEFPKGLNSGIKENVIELTPKAVRKKYAETDKEIDDLVFNMSVEELARLSVCASHGWGMHEKGEAGRIYRLEKYHIPYFAVADGNNGVNVNKPNIGMPCSNTVCATFNRDLAYEVGRVIAEEAKENNIQMILAPAMNIHRNPLNGRHPEYFSEDPYLAGIMAGHQSKGLEENGVSSCIKHAVANNCESARKRNHSIISERALREIYLKVFEVAIGVHNPDSMMTGYNAVNGVFTAEDEEMIQGIFRGEFGFQGFVMTDWNSYDSADVVSAVQAGNCWMTPGTTDNTYVTPIVNGVHQGEIDIERLKSNVRYMLRVIQNRNGKDLGVS
jgi:beta-glucosidase